MPNNECQHLNTNLNTDLNGSVCKDCGKNLSLQVHPSSVPNVIERRHVVAERPFTSPGMSIAGYEDLARIMQTAYDQSAKGKGKERHANDKPFNNQPIMEIARMVGVGGHTYQICKKAQEAGGMVDRGELESAKAELRGAMVYAAAAILLIEGMDK